ncbi:MAG: NAD(P)-binding protein [Desulfobulbaceae bacterium]|nr:NAD(P)-binding protein [Desulfobulbaceae bacterium]
MIAPSYKAAVIGAGPAGLYAARELARKGVRVVIFNLDINPGGLAGVTPLKRGETGT